MKNLILFAGIFFYLLNGTSSLAQAPEDCEDGRYTFEIQHVFDINTVDELFATAINAADDEVELYMTIYMPDDDVVEERPVVVMGFGGSFIGGERADLDDMCRLLAMSGVVAVSIDYRIYPIDKLGFPNIINFYDTAIKAMGDMKAAVRHIRKLVDNGNPYNMDAERIMTGGLSSGSVTALHAAAISENDEISPDLLALIQANGGFEGNTGDEENRAYSSEVMGVINLSGALLDTTFLDASDDIIITSIHGTADETVPFGFGNALGLIPMYGSSVVHERALNQGLSSRLVIVNGGGHTDIYDQPQYEEDRVLFFEQLGESFLEAFCDLSTAAEKAVMKSLTVYPNPASAFLSWDYEFAADEIQIGIYNQLGQLIMDKRVSAYANEIDISELPNGLYHMLIKPLDGELNREVYQTKFVKTNK